MTDDERLAWDTYAAAALGALMAKNATIYMEAERDSHNAAEYADAMLAERRERTGAREERGQDVSDELLADLRRAVHFAVSVSDADGKLVWQPVLDRVLVVEFQRARAAGKGEG